MTSAPVFPVEGAVLDGFGDVGGGEAFNAREVGDGFFQAEGRQYRRDAFGEHGLAAARRPDEEDVVTNLTPNYGFSLSCSLLIL